MTDLVKSMAQILGTGGSLSLNIKNSGAKILVTAQFNVMEGKELETLPAITIKGTAEEIDKHLVTYLLEGVRKVTNTFVDTEAFDAAIAEKATKKGKKPADKSAPTLDLSAAPSLAKQTAKEPVVELVEAAEEVDDFDDKMQAGSEEENDSFNPDELEETPVTVNPNEEPAMTTGSVPGGRPVETPAPVQTPTVKYDVDDEF